MHIGATMGFSQTTPGDYIVAAARLLDDAGLHSL
jgi:hypothetical protein